MITRITVNEMSVAEDVTIIVHGARGLQGRKSGRHKFSVIFGVGSKKYRTDVVKDPTGCPDFNEETVVPCVNPEENVFFTITEKDDILGQLSIPVSSLQSTKGRILRAPLLPHRKCPRPQGELIYQSYVSKFRQVSIQQNDSFSSNNNEPRTGGYNKVKHGTTPILPRKLRKNKRSDTSSIGAPDDHKSKHHPFSTLNKKFSKSLHDLINLARGITDVDEDIKPKSKFRTTSTSYIDEIGKKPVISDITPNVAIISGGTQLVIIGQHLGIDQADIVTLSVCGCDLLNSLNYESTMRIFCTTKPWPAQTGDLILETTSGGKTVIKSAFTFSDTLPRKGSSVGLSSYSSATKAPPSKTSISSSKNNGTPNAVLTPTINGTTPSISVTPAPDVVDGRSSKLNTPLNDTDESCDADQTSNNSKTLESPNKKKYKNKKEGVVTRHQRHNSETVTTAGQHERMQNSWSNEELRAEVNRLELENKALKLENQGMKDYIDKLVSKVLAHCPEALANESMT